MADNLEFQKEVKELEGELNMKNKVKKNLQGKKYTSKQDSAIPTQPPPIPVKSIEMPLPPPIPNTLQLPVQSTSLPLPSPLQPISAKQSSRLKKAIVVTMILNGLFTLIGSLLWALINSLGDPNPMDAESWRIKFFLIPFTTAWVIFSLVFLFSAILLLILWGKRGKKIKWSGIGLIVILIIQIVLFLGTSIILLLSGSFDFFCSSASLIIICFDVSVIWRIIKVRKSENIATDESTDG